MKGNTSRILTEGLFSGMIGYAVVIVLVSIRDLAAGHSPFYTAAVLGSALFYGLEDPAALEVWAGPVLAYNGVHLLTFLLFGVFMAWLASLAERGPQLWYVSLLVFLIVVPHVIGIPIWFTDAVRAAVSLWIVVGATAAAALAMAVYLWRAHPRLREQASDEP